MKYNPYWWRLNEKNDIVNKTLLVSFSDAVKTVPIIKQSKHNLMKNQV